MAYVSYKRFLVTVLFYFAVYTSVLLAETPLTYLTASALPSTEVHKLSILISEIQSKLADKFGVQRVYLAGGSVRALLDHLYFGKALVMRDLDILVVINKKINSEQADKIGRTLASKTLGSYSPIDSHSNIYSNPAINGPAGENYHTGENIFLRWENGGYLDLAMFHSVNDMLLNGLFDMDKILLPLDASQSLEAFVEQDLSTKSYDELVRTDKIHDKYQGYVNYLSKEPKLVNWSDVKADPIKRGVRILRTYAKMGNPNFPDPVRVQLKKWVENKSDSISLGLLGNLLKLLDDGNAVAQLKALQEVGILKVLSKELDIKIHTLSENKLELLLSNATPAEGGFATASSLGRFNVLLQLISSSSEKAAIKKLLLQMEPNVHFTEKEFSICEGYFLKLLHNNSDN